jgi:hypothetical protein
LQEAKVVKAMSHPAFRPQCYIHVQCKQKNHKEKRKTMEVSGHRKAQAQAQAAELRKAQAQADVALSR